jgi:hypothetical protein
VTLRDEREDPPGPSAHRARGAAPRGDAPAAVYTYEVEVPRGSTMVAIAVHDDLAGTLAFARRRVKDELRAGAGDDRRATLRGFSRRLSAR